MMSHQALPLIHVDDVQRIFEAALEIVAKDRVYEISSVETFTVEPNKRLTQLAYSSLYS